MILWLVQWLAPPDSPLRALEYITVRALLAGASAFLLALLLGRRIIARLHTAGVAENAGASDSAEVGRVALAAGKHRTPTMGGVFWVSAILCSTLVYANPGELLVLLGAVLVVGMGAIGFMDDWIKWKHEHGRNGLSRSAKLLASLALTTYVAVSLWLIGERTGRPEMCRIYLPVLKDLYASPELLGAFGLPLFAVFTSFVILATCHAANVTDGLDGLAAGSGLIAFLALTVAAYAVGHFVLADYLSLPFIPGAGEVAVLGAAAVGATLGFLWFNCHPAQIFLGDAGSLPLGALVGYLAIVSKQELALPLLAGVFVLEVGTSLLQILYFKLSGGRRLFRIAPLHHLYQLRGLPEQKIVARFWIGGAVSAALGLLLIKVR
ncbi:MAG: phospho-N-acetylmuramoyl-pentapeptide-transferase [Planctomycetota bacterium]|nr:MAG: phospho-N-acetylmuramoyl-pentapeptide-transferase [Planctomycetota bacterium]